MNADDRALAIAARIADGSGIDWPQAGPGDMGDSAVLEELKTISKLATLHRTPHESDGDATALEASRWGLLSLLEQIGEGRFGRVYRAWDARLHRHVALKLLFAASPAAASPTHAIEEARLLARVRHPNVLTVHGAEYLNHQVGIWTEFIEGRTLETLLAERGPLPADEVIAIGLDLCRALGAVHAAGLLHRDVKLQNVMRETGGRIVLMDFGTGHDLELVPARAGDLTGTPLYLAPEIFKGAQPTQASDLYALAVLLFRLVTGAYPMAGKTLDDVRRAHDTGRTGTILSSRPRLPTALADAVEHGLASDPARRYATAADFEAALAALHHATDAPATSAAGTNSRRRWLVAGAAVLATVASLVGWRVWARPARVVATLGPHDWVLVGAFENGTGEALFDGTVQYWIERELAGASSVRIIPRPRVDDVLQLMKRPADSVLSPNLAREVAVRDGDIPVFVDGRIDRREPGYAVLASLVSTESGQVLATAVETAPRRELVVDALQRLSADLRERLGVSQAESLKSGTRRQDITTPSLRAFQLYSRAYEVGTRQQAKESLVLAREAVAADPTFASAWIWIAWMEANTGHRQEASQAAERALALAGSTTNEERLWIRASAHQINGEVDDAITDYKALVALRPEHYWAVANLSRLAGESQYSVARAELLPYDLQANWMAASALFVTGGAATEVEHYRKRGADLVSPTQRSAPVAAASLLLFPARLRLFQGDVRGAQDELAKALADQRIGTEARQVLLRDAARIDLSLGRAKAAKTLIADLSSEAWRNTLLGITDYFLLGRASEARRELAAVSWSDAGPLGVPFLTLPAGLMLRLGLVSEVVRAIESEADGRLSNVVDPDSLKSVQAQVEAARGQSDDAIPLLEGQLPGLTTMRRQLNGNEATEAEYYLTTLALADAWLKKAQPTKAAEVLAVALDQHFRYESVLLRLVVEARLAALDRRLGRLAAAVALEAHVNQMLELADPAFVQGLAALSDQGLAGIAHGGA